MDKKKLIIIIVSSTLVLGVCGLLGYKFFILDKDNETKEVDKNKNEEESKKEQFSEEQSIEEPDQKIKVLESITLALGSKLPTIKDFTDEEVEDATIEIYDGKKKVTSKTLDKVGEYTVKIIIGEKEYESTIKVVDEEKPELTLMKVTIKEGKSYKVSSFVKSCTDNRGEDCELSFAKSAMGKYTKVGTYDIEIIAKDESGNSISKKTKLVIEKEKTTEKEDENKEENTNTDKEDEKENNSGGNESGSQEQEKEPEQSTEQQPTPPSEEESTEEEPEETIKTTEEWRSTASSNASTYSSMINEVLENVNAYRAEVGAAPLTLDTNLTLAANVRAVEMGTYNGWNISHTRPNGTSCFTVLSELGISYRTAGENIAAGYASADSVSEGWKNSSGHYANMIATKFTKIGIGVAKVGGVYYWVQLFIG